ncbi:MAG: IPT/TIG domain-containing protein, partial [Thermoanaerobaculia bacterium]
CIITGNEVRGAAGTGAVPAGGNAFGGGIDIDGTTTVINCVVRNNIARGGNGYTQPTSGSGGIGGDSFGGGANSFTSATFLDNTFYANSAIAGNGGSTPPAGGGAGGEGGSSFYALYCSNGPLKNNIVANNVTTAGSGGTGSINGANGTAWQAGMLGAQPTTSYNLLFGNSVGDVDGGPNSVVGQDPLFISSSDLHLRSSSPARGAGTGAGTPTIDLDGNPRTSPPTIGAYEIGLFLTAYAGIGRITVTWTGVSGATSYNLYMSQSPGVTTFSFQKKITAATSPFVLAPLASATWYFVITAIENGVEGPISPEVSATTTVGAWGKAPAGSNFTNITRDLASGTTLYATANDSVGLYKSTDSGDSWTPLPGPFSGIPMRAVAANGSNVLVAGTGSIYRSTNGGTLWTTPVSGAGIGEDFVASVAIDPLAPTLAYAGDFHITGTTVTDLVAKSVDSGANFTNLASGDIRAYFIQIDPTTAGTVYAAGSGTPNVAKSINGGTDWTSASPVAGYPTALALAPSAPLTLYSGMRNVSNSASIGVYKTVNGGGTPWTQMNTGLPSAPIPNVDALLAESADANRVHAGTDAGYYSSANGASNWAAGPAGGSYPSNTLFFNSFAQTSTRRLVGTTSTGIYMLALDPAPAVTAALSPSSGSSSGGTTVTITGTGFKSGVTVMFGGTPGTVTGSTGTSITVTSPPHAAGAVDVAVSNTDGQTAVVSNGFTYTAPVCTYFLGSSNASFTSAGGNSSVSVTAPTACAWSAMSNDAFITITSGSPGAGNGTLNYSVATNSGPARTGTMTIAAQTFTVNQDAAAGTPTRKGDFNGDGKADIFWRNSASGSNSMWLINGLAVTASAGLPLVGDTNFKVAGIGDFQGDGKADILWRNSV